MNPGLLLKITNYNDSYKKQKHNKNNKPAKLLSFHPDGWKRDS